MSFDAGRPADLDACMKALAESSSFDSRLVAATVAIRLLELQPEQLKQRRDLNEYATAHAKCKRCKIAARLKCPSHRPF